jgi:transcriptional regulator with XRE-family HTH domain
MAAGCTQVDVAAEAGLATRVVQRAEQGQRRINLGEAAAIARSLGRSLDELVQISAGATFEPPTMGRPRRADRP